MATGSGAFAQVGIFTDPQGMFHVDPMKNTQESSITSDDVIVTSEGNAGIGLLPEPATPYSLTLTGGGTPAAPRSPLRIEDGNQKEGRVLTIDDNGEGYGTWKDLPANFKPGQVYGFIDIPGEDFPFSNDHANYKYTGFSFKADAAGSYIFEVRWWGRFNKNKTGITSIHFALHKNAAAAAVDEFEQYAGVNATDVNCFTVCFTLYADAVKDDVFTLKARPGLHNVGGLSIATQDSPVWAWAQSKVKITRTN